MQMLQFLATSPINVVVNKPHLRHKKDYFRLLTLLNDNLMVTVGLVEEVLPFLTTRQAKHLNLQNIIWSSCEVKSLLETIT